MGGWGLAPMAEEARATGRSVGILLLTARP
jgi:hypothetical protein